MREENGTTYLSDTCSVLVVIVLYKLPANESIAFQTLQRATANLQQDKARVKILLYDNTPSGQGHCDLPSGVQYEAAEHNGGLATAYNRALAIARSEHYTWLLTLDQDSVLPHDYLSRMAELAHGLESNKRVAVIVPTLIQDGTALSPVFINTWGGSTSTRDFSGIAKRETHAYNSASLFRVDALNQIGGFNPYFWLDYLDAYVYRQLHQCGKDVYVAGDIRIEHNLSLLSPQDLSISRFHNFLMAESAFWDLYGSWIQRMLLTARLVGRIWRQRMRSYGPAFSRLTWTMLRKRLLQSRARRIDDWRKDMERIPSLSLARGAADSSHVERPAISVCMAAYNGERYIVAQLQSILSQLTVNDEVIVVDDASTDGTRNCVESLQDGRIQLICHRPNLGVSRTFEDAIRAASHSILFLSDQDDLWAPNKVLTILRQFEDDPDLTLVASDAALIDADGETTSSSYFATRGKFKPGLWANLIRNRFGGCTMAFRATLIRTILPLPHDYDVLHDVWIGVRASLSGQNILYIPQALVLSRRHSTTVTGKKTLTLQRRITIRLHLLIALTRSRLRRAASGSNYG